MEGEDGDQSWQYVYSPEGLYGLLSGARRKPKLGVEAMTLPRVAWPSGDPAQVTFAMEHFLVAALKNIIENWRSKP